MCAVAQSKEVPWRQGGGGRDMDSEVFVPETIIPINERELFLSEGCVCKREARAG